MVQRFKENDLVEAKFLAAGAPVFDLTSSTLDDFLEGGAESSPFLLMLYDEGRMPFSNRIPREAFVEFIKQALANFPVSGTFEAYIFVLKAVFGDLTEINFEVPAPGKLSIEVNAAIDVEFDFIGREFADGAYEFFNVTTQDGDTLVFRGISGIDTEYELSLLFAEIMPAGIFPTIALDYITRYFFIAEDETGIYDVIDHDGNQIIFYDVGG